MPKAWWSINLFRQQGFSAIEILLAATIFGLLVTGIIGALVYGRAGTASAGDRQRAVLLAEEGIEAIRNIGNHNYANLTDGTFGLAQGGGVWTLSGSSDTNGIYTRQIAITTVGDDRKTVSATVSWPAPGGTVRSVSLMSRLTNWLASLTPPSTPGPIIMAYSKSTATPYYRIWDGTNWSGEASAQDVVGNINYIVLKSSEKRNEAILGVQTSTGAIYMQIWDGTSWGNLTQVGTGTTTTRSFDIAYEKNSGKAVIAYAPTASSADFAYRTWDGSALSGATTVTAPPTTGALNWLELRQNPLNTSNEIAMIMLDANADVYGMAWTGSTWSNMGTATVWDATASTATRKGVDIEYEQTSGRAMFAWGDATATDSYYRIWNGSALTSATLLDIPAMGGVTNWLQLAARPNSNEIMIGIQDAGADLNTRKWSGSAWDTATQHPEHDATTENIASRNFDIVWETHTSNPGKAWLIWGDGATRSESLWSSTSWGAATIASGSDDTSYVRLRADPVSGAVFSGIYQCSCSAGNQRDINERRLINGGAAWSTSNQLWGGPTTADPAHFKIDIATP